jgi:hypothetical protein
MPRYRAAVTPKHTQGEGKPLVTVAHVRKLALAMPDTAERPSYGTPGFRVKDRLFARVLDDETIVVKVDLAWRDGIVRGSPDVFYVTPHYQPYPWVIVRLGAIDIARLGEILAAAREVEAGQPPARKRPTSRRPSSKKRAR